MENETITTADTDAMRNGIPTSPESTEITKTPAEKPWHKAGFKSRSEWRASKKPEKKQVVAAAKASKPKPKKKVKAAAKSAKPKSAKKKVKAAAPKKMKAKSKVKAKAKKVAKKSVSRPNPDFELSRRHKAVLGAFGGIGKKKSIREIADKAFPTRSFAQRSSWVRNQLRTMLFNKYVRKVKPGTYERVK